MTYDEWETSQYKANPSQYGGMMLGGNSKPLPPPPSLGGLLPDMPDLGGTVYNAFRRAENFLRPRATTNPSFAPMRGERLALQMPGLERLKRYLLQNPPPGLRDMPRYGGSNYEQNTQYIPGPQQPASTPYPRPPWMNFSNYMNTGERGPLPLEARRPGGYPAPANAPIPEAYDTLISGGGLA